MHFVGCLRCEDVRLCFDEEVLAPPALVEAGQQGDYRFFLPQKRIICIKFRKMMQKTTRMRQFT